MASGFSLVRADCGHQTHYFSPTSSRCPNCGSEWLEARYDYAALSRNLPGSWAKRNHSLWRYKELFPLRDPANIVTLGEGGTPLIKVVNLGMMLGRSHIYVKDERQSPTGSFKDRQAALAV